MLATVRKLGGSVAIVIPKGMAISFQLAPGTTVDLTEGETGIIVRRARYRKRRAIDELVGEINSSAYARHRKQLAVDKPVGKEVW
jgi:antitoxin component of MazEF toxin-antitoxin module